MLSLSRREMDAGKAAGPDGMHPSMLQNMPENIVRVVSDIFLRSFEEIWVL